MAGEGEGAGSKSIEKLLADNASQRKSIQELTKRNEELEEAAKSRQASKRSRREDSEEEDNDPSEGQYLTEDRMREVIRDEVTGWWNAQTQKATEEQQRAQQFLSKRQEWLVKAYEKFPDAKSKDSELSKRASEIFKDPANDLADAEGIPTRPSAEYDAYARASLEVATDQAVAAAAKAGASFAAAGGSGAGAGPSQKTALTDAEFLALTPEQRTKYQLEKAGLT